MTPQSKRPSKVGSAEDIDTYTPIGFDLTRPIVVVITEADKLSKDAQHALRRIMEKYMANCRYILVCNSTNKVIGPLRSRCLGIRVSAPSHTEVCCYCISLLSHQSVGNQIHDVLHYVTKKENLVLPPELAHKVSALSGRNLRKALLMLETCRVQR